MYEFRRNRLAMQEKYSLQFYLISATFHVIICYVNTYKGEVIHMARKTHHVVPNSDRGGWDVKRGGASKASKHFDTKKDAEQYGREVIRNP